MSRRLLVIDPSTAWPETQGVGVVTGLWGGEATVWTPALDPGAPAPRDAAAFAGVVLLGSRASVHDDAPWIRALGDVLGPVVEGAIDRALLGVCFGHQWLAHVAGGAVGFAREDRSKIVGVEETRFHDGRLVPGGGSLRVIVSHRETVTRPPAGYRATASRASCAVDALEHADRRLYGVQFHPEAREDFARAAGIEASAVDARVRRDSERLLRTFLASV